MHRTVEAIIHPDGSIEALEPIIGSGIRRALVTILEELPLPIHPEVIEVATNRLIAQLRSEGFIEIPEEIPNELAPLSETERALVAQQIPHGTPLSAIIMADREESF